MPVKEYDIKFKISGDKKFLDDFKKNLKKLVTEEIGPEMFQVMKDIFLYRKMLEGIPKKWQDFLLTNAGIFTAAIMKNIEKKRINMQSPNTHVRLDRVGMNKELIISAAATEAAAKEFEESGKSPEAIMRIITKLDDETAKNIFEDALAEAGWK